MRHKKFIDVLCCFVAFGTGALNVWAVLSEDRNIWSAVSGEVPETWLLSEGHEPSRTQQMNCSEE